MTHWHQPLSIAGDTSPVYAPEISQKQSCAPSFTVVPSSTSAMASSHGNGGKMATSMTSGWAIDAGITPLTRSRASPALTGFIFQLAASSALGETRAGTPLLRLLQNCDSRQLPPLEVLEGGSAAGRNP